MATIPCTEGMVVEGGSDDGITYPSVTSCMTITCLLDGGAKVGAHDAIFQRVQPQVFMALKGKIGKRTVQKVRAAGSGSSWTPRMTSQVQLSEDFAKNDKTWASKKWSDQLAAMESFLISRNEEQFRRMLAWQFAVDLADVTFNKFDEGNIEILDDGTLLLNGVKA